MVQSAFHIGDVNVKLTFTVKDEKARIVILDSVDINLLVQKPDGIQYEWKDIDKIYDDIGDGEQAIRFSYSMKTGDLDQAGTYIVQPKLTWTDGSGKAITTSRITFPVLSLYDDNS